MIEPFVWTVESGGDEMTAIVSSTPIRFAGIGLRPSRSWPLLQT
jgi:hypothetical protein